MKRKTIRDELREIKRREKETEKMIKRAEAELAFVPPTTKIGKAHRATKRRKLGVEARKQFIQCVVWTAILAAIAATVFHMIPR